MIFRNLTTFVFLLTIQPLLFAQDEPSAAEKEATAPLKQVQGMWTITKGVNQGKELSEDELEGMHVLVKRYMMITYDRDDQERYRATFKIDSSEEPAEINLTSLVKGQPPANAAGIIQIDKDRWKICYALPGHPRPTKFESTESDSTMLFVHERLKKASLKDEPKNE